MLTDSVRPPLVPAGCDLMNFGRMPLVVHRLLASETWIEAARDPRLGHALMSMWAAAWHQVPAGSLPAADNTLQRFSMCPTDKEWRRVRERVLRDWLPCSDGRLYHPVVAELAIECWLEKLTQRRKSVAGNAKKYGLPIDMRQIDALEVDALRMLRALNPNSPALTKKRPVQAPLPLGQAGASFGGPTGSGQAGPEGSHGAPTGSAEGLPQGSQGKGRDLSPKPPAPRGGQLDPGADGAGTGGGVDGGGTGGGQGRSGMPQHVRQALTPLLPVSAAASPGAVVLQADEREVRH